MIAGLPLYLIEGIPTYTCEVMAAHKRLRGKVAATFAVTIYCAGDLQVIHHSDHAIKFGNKELKLRRRNCSHRGAEGS